jgi:AcrR family transcriptional regulator
LRERIREVTTDAILGAAEEVFAAQGLHAARMEAIAAQAGVAVGTLYNHFKDRDALLGALVDARRTELLGRLERSLAESKGKPFPEQLRLFVGALIEHLEAHKPFLTIIMEGETASPPRTVHGVGRSRDLMRQVYDRAVELVRRGVAQKVLRHEDAEVFPTLLMGMMKGCMLRRLYYAGPAEGSMDRRADQIVRFFLHGAGVER